MKKKSKKHRGPTTVATSPVKGFDLGEQQTVMGVADFTFIEHLNRAKVFACGYGLKAVEGVDAPVPFLALVGEEQSGFEEAFKVFSDWGCEADGDVVDVQMMLRNDGGYDLWVGPEIERALLRTVPEAGLYRANFFNVAWVKHLDSTNPAIQQLGGYITSAVSPLIFAAAIGDPKNATRETPDFKFVDGLPRVMKFDLEIRTERENPDDRRFHVGDEDIPLNERDDPRRAMSPFTYCWRRKKTIDIAFPVSRERVRRSDLIPRVRGLPGYTDVSGT